MKKSLILSSLRIELRRKKASYITERTTVRWVEQFLDEMAITHSSQIRTWQRDSFIRNLQNQDELIYEELLQARSSLLFLYEMVLKKSPGFITTSSERPGGSDTFRIPA